MADTLSTKKLSADPLPYIIVFAILFLIALGVLTWVLNVFYKSYSCNFYPGIWCSDNWTCQTSCTGALNPQNLPVSPCFSSVDSTGLASCLYGPDAPGAFVCFSTPTGGTPIGGTATSCDCPANLDISSVHNCFNGCGMNLSQIKERGVCCCNDPSNPNCSVNSQGQGIGICGS